LSDIFEHFTVATPRIFVACHSVKCCLFSFGVVDNVSVRKSPVAELLERFAFLLKLAGSALH